MIPLDGQPVLTTAAMRAAEAAAIARGASVGSLMTAAGTAVAEAVRRLAAGNEVLVLCGPGNNGGDGYVAATILKAGGLSVHVAASADPRTSAAKYARAGWDGPVEPLADAQPAPVLVDAIFGTGLSRPLDQEIAAALSRLVHAATLSIAVDVPSGVSTDDGVLLGECPSVHLTLALGAAKPAHVLQPAATACGTVRVLDIGIGIDVASEMRVITRPKLPMPGPDSHKYSRGMVAVAVGDMPGAARLAATAAARAGAGYVALYGDAGPGGPDALVHRPLSIDALREPRIGSVLVGPGLGRGDDRRALLTALLEEDTHRLVIDGDALHLLDPDSLRDREQPVILTPHAGEFDALFGRDDRSSIDRARDAAARTGATIVFKGATTVIASATDIIVSPGGSPWLSTAGTGDVLAGAIAAMFAAGQDGLDAAIVGVWLHAAAARRLGPAFIADDLAQALTGARSA